MAVLGLIFFVLLPPIVLVSVTHLSSSGAVEQISKTPFDAARRRPSTDRARQSPTGKTAYALSVFLFAPIAVVVPLTISTAVGAATIVGERERGTGEFLAHSPATIARDLPRQAPRQLHPRLPHGGDRLRLLLPCRQPRGRAGGRRLVLPDLAMARDGRLGHPAVPRLHALARCASLGEGQVDCRGTTGIGPGEPSVDPGRLQRRARDRCSAVSVSGFIVGAAAWTIALASLARGTRSLTRSRLLGVGDGL